MTDLLRRIDPATGEEIDAATLKARVEEKLSISVPLRPKPTRKQRPWLVVVAGFAAALAIAVPIFLSQESEPRTDLTLDQIRELPGVDAVIPVGLAGGVRTMAVDGDTLWVTSALTRDLFKIHAVGNDMLAEYPIDAYVEGVAVGGGYVWVHSYDNDGEIFRFDPGREMVDLSISLSSPAVDLRWSGDHLWVGTEDDEIHRIADNGEIRSTISGELRGEPDGTLWIVDESQGVMTAIMPDGPSAELPIGGIAVRQVISVGSQIWVLEESLVEQGSPLIHRFGPGGVSESISVGIGPHSMVEWGGSVWVTSHIDHTLTRIDAETLEVVSVSPTPGKPGGLIVADGSLWVALFHPGG